MTAGHIRKELKRRTFRPPGCGFFMESYVLILIQEMRDIVVTSAICFIYRRYLYEVQVSQDRGTDARNDRYARDDDAGGLC